MPVDLFFFLRNITIFVVLVVLACVFFHLENITNESVFMWDMLSLKKNRQIITRIVKYYTFYTVIIWNKNKKKLSRWLCMAEILDVYVYLLFVIFIYMWMELLNTYTNIFSSQCVHVA